MSENIFVFSNRDRVENGWRGEGGGCQEVFGISKDNSRYVVKNLMINKTRQLFYTYTSTYSHGLYTLYSNEINNLR